MSNYSLSISQQLCSSIEEFSINAAGHNIRPLKIQPGVFNSYYSMVEASDFILMIRQVEYPYSETGEFKPDTYGFAFMSNNGSIVYNGRKYKHDEKLATDGHELNSMLSSNLRMVTCFLDEANLQRYFSAGEIEQFHQCIKTINHKSRRIKTDNNVALYLNALILNLSKKSLVIANELIYRDLCEEIYLKMFNYVTDTSEDSCINIKPKHRLDLLKKALVYIHENDIKNIAVSDIAQHIFTSQRNLQKLFLQYLEITPKAYLIGVRLNRIYHDLLEADPKTTNIKDVSEHYGVVHQGNFARDYHEFFGEYPKDTLKKTRDKKIRLFK
jgi:AraC-like DNA-binding protein